MLKKFLPLVVVTTFGLIACQSQEPITLKISNPGTILSTNGTLTVQVDVTGGKPESVTLLKNGAPFATVPAPYQYAWNTTTEPEGTYFLTAKATRGGQGFSASEEFTSPPRTVVVDRTPPTVVSRTPAPDQADVDVKGSISVTFSEPVDPKTVEDSAIDLKIDNLSAKKVLTLSSDLKTVEVKPTDELDPTKPASYLVSIAEKMKDNAGNLVVLPKGSWDWRISGWKTIGDTSLNLNVNMEFGSYSLALDSSENPVMAWVEVNTNLLDSIYVKKWTGSEWVSVGSGPINTSPKNLTGDISVAVNSKNDIFLAWSERENSGAEPRKLSVKHWNGSAWNLLGLKGVNEITGVQTVAGGFTLSLDQNGLPVVAWTNTYEGAFAKRWTGSEWLLVGSGNLGSDFNNILGKPSISLGQGKDLFVALISNGNIVVKKWSGSTWEFVGSGIINQGISATDSPLLAVGRDGNPVVVWSRVNQIFVQRWNGSAWTVIDSEGLKQNVMMINCEQIGFDCTPSIFINSKNNPVIAAPGINPNLNHLYNTCAFEWTGGSWKIVDKAFTYNTAGLNPLLLLTSNDIPIIAYREIGGSMTARTFKLVVKRYSR
jgi:Bacterial Ig-like domain/Bacterial Ig domain